MMWLVTALLAIGLAADAMAGPVEVYLLGGQSNMHGYGTTAELPSSMQQPLSGAFIWNGASFEALQPGTTFGPELGFAQSLLELNPDRTIYLIKSSRDGTALDSGWDDLTWVGDPPGSNRINFYAGTSPSDPNRGTSYKTMINHYNAGLDYLQNNNIDYQAKGFVWVQGEQDAKNAVSAGRYATDLAELNGRLHEDLGLSSGTLPVVYAQVLGSPDGIAPSKFTDRTALRQSQANADANSGNAASISNAHMVSTAGLNLRDDIVHYNTSGQLLLGERLAEAMVSAQGGTIPLPVGPASLSVNFGISTNSSNSVNVNEVAIDRSSRTAGGEAITAARAMSGLHWNHVLLQNGSSSAVPTTFTAATQNGSVVTLLNNNGDQAGLVTSSGQFYSNFSNASGAQAGSTGDGALMESYLALNDSESLTVSSLGKEFTADGYSVFVFFDIGNYDRTYGVNLLEGPGGNAVAGTFWTMDTAATDSDANNDGLIEWVQATGNTSAEATLDANFAVFSGLTADSFTLRGTNLGGRAVISGFQVVANPVPEPGTLGLLGAGGLLWLLALVHRRWK